MENCDPCPTKDFGYYGECMMKRFGPKVSDTCPCGLCIIKATCEEACWDLMDHSLKKIGINLGNIKGEIV